MAETDHPRHIVCNVAIVGAGPAGLAAGLAASLLGLKTVIIGPRSNPADGRTAALFQPAIAMLRRIGAWRAIAVQAEPLRAIRLIDATGALFRAPETLFRASEIGLDAFGYNVANGALTEALEDAAAGRLTRLESPVAGFDIAPDLVRLTCADGAVVEAQLVGGADGRNSMARTAAGISVTSRRYDQTAIVTSFTHARPHGGVSTEFHRRSGPLTLVPGPGSTSSLVFVETDAGADRLVRMDDAHFARELQDLIGGMLGRLTAFAPRRSFPLMAQTAATLAARRIALIGEAGHVLPPIGAQGLNLSFRDAATFAANAADAVSAGRDPGGADALAAYAAARESDVKSRAFGVDLLNRSLIADVLPVDLVRGFGLAALKSLPALRRAAMRQGIAPGDDLPTLMRPLEMSP